MARVVVIGAGVVGLAVARALALGGREVIVLEAERAIGMHTSSRNSEVIHAGFYYPTGTWKARLCVPGRDALYAYCAAAEVAHRRVGKIVGALPDHHRDAGLAQPLGDIAFGAVGALHRIAEVVHHLGDAGHADPADADEVDGADVGADRLHAAAPAGARVLARAGLARLTIAGRSPCPTRMTRSARPRAA